jgi:hypothetical protein
VHLQEPEELEQVRPLPLIYVRLASITQGP